MGGTKFPAEVRERAVRLVLDHSDEHGSEWAAICSIAEKFGCAAETLRKWVRQAQRDQGKRPGLTTLERDRLKELERENRELKRAYSRRQRPPARRRSTRRGLANRGNEGAAIGGDSSLSRGFASDLEAAASVD